jgi:uncharacterized protein (TIGR04222 family)
MNPFDLPGPSFLLFYLLLIAGAAAAFYLSITALEDGATPTLPLGNPYQIAWLRGGAREAVRVAVLSLLDRNLVELGVSAVTTRVTDVSAVDQPIERAILRRCMDGGELLSRLPADPMVAAACERLRDGLTRLGLVPNDAQQWVRRGIFAVTVAVLAAVALGKLAIAFERGRSNVGFLIVLALAAPVALGFLLAHRRTRLGDRMLADLRRLFAGLRNRAQAIRRGEATNDAMLLAAVFGIAALPTGAYFDLQRASTKATQSGSNSCGGGGDGGGGGCGGGGGGCGGCGSG